MRLAWSPYRRCGRKPHAPERSSGCRIKIQDGRSAAGGPALDWLSTPGMFVGLSFRREVSLEAGRLVQATLLWAWGEETSLVDRFFGRAADYRAAGEGQQESVSYQAFVKLLRRHTALLLMRVVARVAAADAGRPSASRTAWRATRHSASTGRGSTCRAPRRTSGCSAPRHCRTRRRGRRRRADQKKAAAPRLWLTTLWHLEYGIAVGLDAVGEPGERANICWRCSPGSPSGR